MSEEGLKETPNKLIHVGEPIEMDDELFEKQLVMLEKACTSEAKDIKQIVASVISGGENEICLFSIVMFLASGIKYAKHPAFTVYIMSFKRYLVLQVRMICLYHRGHYLLDILCF